MRWLVAFFIVFFPLSLRSSELEKVKQLIAEKQKALASAMSEGAKSSLLYELALAYYQDQEIDVAFSYFLEALKRVPKKSAELHMEERESLLYKSALEDYLTRAGSDPAYVAGELLQKYGEEADQNRDFIHLNFLIATAYANLSKYDDFFDRFYKGYPYLHDTFLAYKTQGILYLRLSHHGKSTEERQGFQAEAFKYLTGAVERNPQDPSLYKVLIFLAKDEKNKELIRSYLQRIVDYKVELPRCDICLYVKEAVWAGEVELGQEIIDRARALYDYSRAISTAQEYLNQQR